MQWLSNKASQPGGLKQYKCILSWFWRPGVQNQGVVGENQLHIFLLASGIASNSWHSLASRCITTTSACLYINFFSASLLSFSLL